jgi:hypothetical protein
MTVTFERTGKLAKFPHRRDLWGTTGAAALLPARYPHALLGPAYDALSTKSAQAERTFEVDGPPLSLDGARREAGVASGPATYFPEQSAWVLEAEDTTHIVAPGRKEQHAGRLVALVEALTQSGTAEVTLFDGAAAEDPGGHVGFLRGKGFQASAERQKGGTYRGAVEVRAGNLPKLLQALRERNLRVEGFDVR